MACFSGCASVTTAGDAGAGGCVTQVSGTVLAPNGVDPIPGALIYVTREQAPALPSEVRCEPCGQPGTEQLELLAQTQSGASGAFTLTLTEDTIADTTALYIQKGRWRRRVEMVRPAACQRVTLDPRATRLPRDRSEGEIPSIAVGVGDYDAIECVLRHLGLAPREFSAPSGTGAVHLYDNTALRGGAPDPSATLLGLLLAPARLRRYPMLLINCTDESQLALLDTPAVRANLLDYVAAGGRLYLSDWAYNLLAQQPRFADFVCFDDGGASCLAPPVFQAAARGLATSFTAQVPDNLSIEQAAVLGLSTFLGQPQISLDPAALPISMPLNGWALLREAGYDARYPALTWLRGRASGAQRPLTVSFDYPSPVLNASGACGRVLYTSPHTRERPPLPGPSERSFPGYCQSGVTPQERTLEYLIFEVSACIPRPG